MSSLKFLLEMKVIAEVLACVMYLCLGYPVRL